MLRKGLVAAERLGVLVVGCRAIANMAVDGAITRVRAHRPGAIETLAQEQYVYALGASEL